MVRSPLPQPSGLCCYPSPLSPSEPVVQFTSSQYEVQEPLSNFPPDLTFVTLTVTRGGDLSLPSTLTFSTLEATAEAGIDFRPAAGMLTFQRGQNVTSMAVQVLSNHQSQESVVFHVVLTDSSAVRVGEPGQTAVLIHNRPVAGVFFPDLPLLASPSPHGEILYGAQLPSDGPLICVTVSSLAGQCRCQEVEAILGKVPSVNRTDLLNMNEALRGQYNEGFKVPVGSLKILV